MELIERCMAAEPESRPEAQEVVAILQALKDGPAPHVQDPVLTRSTRHL